MTTYRITDIYAPAYAPPGQVGYVLTLEATTRVRSARDGEHMVLRTAQGVPAPAPNANSVLCLDIRRGVRDD